MRNAVIGQTGRSILSASDGAVSYKIGKRQTVRYQYQKLQHGFMAWVCGPFHSRTYGACGIGSTRAKAKAAIETNLANNYGYIGHMLFSDVDEADGVGGVDERLLDQNETARPITFAEAWGSAGM